ncbi:hypothetical protein FACS1894200_11590 [Spirochaetia bacterium]|nr:hypothetical protein FACS1894200_11590 [Spirochaetia bacterium]
MIHSIIHRVGTVAALLFALHVASCTPEEASTAQHRADIPLRLVSAASSNTEIIIGLGLAQRLVAVDPYSVGLPGLAPDILYIDFFNPDAEALIQLAPDLIIASGINETSTELRNFSRRSRVSVYRRPSSSQASVLRQFTRILSISPSF